MSGELRLTVVGNLVGEPELNYTPASKAVVKFRIANNPRYRDAQGQWKDGKPSFVPCVVWGPMAENIAESFKQGSRVIATGEWKQREYETREGEKRMTWELNVDGIGPDVRYGTARFNKMERSSAGAAPAGGGDADPWASDWPSEEPPRGF